MSHRLPDRHRVRSADVGPAHLWSTYGSNEHIGDIVHVAEGWLGLGSDGDLYRLAHRWQGHERADPPGHPRGLAVAESRRDADATGVQAEVLAVAPGDHLVGHFEGPVQVRGVRCILFANGAFPVVALYAVVGRTAGVHDPLHTGPASRLQHIVQAHPIH